MARYNAVFAGPVEKLKPQVRELPAAVDLTPGSIVVASGGQFALATAATTGKVYVVQENYLTMKGPDTSITAGNTAIGLEMADDCLYRARVATGTNVTLDAALAPGANGELVLAGAADRVVAFAAETYNNTSGSAQLVQVRPANGFVSAA